MIKYELVEKYIKKINPKSKEEAETLIKDFVGEEKIMDGDKEVELKNIDFNINEVEEEITEDEVIEEKVKTAVKKIMDVGQRKNYSRIYQVEKKDYVPERCKSYNIKNFSGNTMEEKNAKAYKMGSWFYALAASKGFASAQRSCDELGIDIKAQSEGTNSEGGYTVPTEVAGDIIRLREEFGVIRKNARRINMVRDIWEGNIDATDQIATPVGENSAIAESNKNYSQQTLTARKWGVITYASNELIADSIIDIADNLVLGLSQAFAYAEDRVGWQGNGGAGDNYVTGLLYKMLNGNAQVYTASGKRAWDELTMSDFTTMIGMLASYARNPKWYCSIPFWASTMVTLSGTAGGNTQEIIENGKPTKTFRGYPVEVVEGGLLPNGSVTDPSGMDIECVFADLSVGTLFGDRKSLKIDISEQGGSAWVNDQLSVRGISRFDINHYKYDNLECGVGLALG